MSALVRGVLVGALVLASSASAQLLLILGKPNQGQPAQYAASTAEVGPDGTVALRDTIIDPSSHRGFFWFDIDYDLRQAYLLDDNFGAVILDLNSGRVAKRCQVPPTKGLVEAFEWRIIDPVEGPAFALERGTVKPGNSIVVGLLADSAIPCAESSLVLREEQIVGYATGGLGGVGGEVAQPVFLEM